MDKQVLQNISGWLGRIVALGLLIWVAQMAWTQWQALLPLEVPLQWGPLLWGIQLIGVAQLLLIKNWQDLLRWLGVSISFRQAFSIFTISALGRYLPGKILVVVGRVAFLERLGVPRTKGLQAWVWEISLILLVGGLLASFSPNAALPQLVLQALGGLSTACAFGGFGWIAYKRNFKAAVEFCLAGELADVNILHSIINNFRR